MAKRAILRFTSKSDHLYMNELYVALSIHRHATLGVLGKLINVGVT